MQIAIYRPKMVAIGGETHERHSLSLSSLARWRTGEGLMQQQLAVRIIVHMVLYVVGGRVYPGWTDEQVIAFDSALAADIFLENDITRATTI